LLIPPTEHGFSVEVILCGCPRACGNKEESKAKAKHHLLVAGESINDNTVQEAHFSTAVQHELENILNQ
jgi:hypothetical protein